MKDHTPSEFEVKRSDVLEALQRRVRQTIEEVIEEELCAALGAGRSERAERRLGYRNGKTEREVTTELGVRRLKIPRARTNEPDGTSREWRSAMLPAYQRRTRRVDEAILGVYLAGANTRRIRKALEPLLGSSNLSKSAISRVVSRLKTSFETWSSRELSQEHYSVLYLDAIFLAVRVARRVVRIPVQVVLGVQSDGQKVIVAMRSALSESRFDWSEMVRSLSERGLADPVVVIADGCAGLLAAINELWATTLLQRCTQHKRENLLAKVPAHARDELKRDYRAITHALDGERALRAYHAFLQKWRTLCPAAAKSLEEAGLNLLTFYRFPRSQWKSLRSTNTLERLNQEFRRRVKTQGSFPNETAALVLLYGLMAFGQIRLRRITGWKHVAAMGAIAREAVA